MAVEVQTCMADTSTKRLLQRIKPGQVAVLQHRDLDQIAAEALIDRGVKAVINTCPTFSGRYAAPGPKRLLEAHMPVLDLANPDLIQCFHDGMVIWLKEDIVGGFDKTGNPYLIAHGRRLTWETYMRTLHRVKRRFHEEFISFVENSLRHADQEKELLLSLSSLPALKTQLTRRVVVIVARGTYYKEDLRLMKEDLQQIHPVYIGVDGGADALFDEGLIPEMIIGDMDSVSDQALACGAELVVHAYPDGRAPGLARIEKRHLAAHLFPAPGTSEDAALLLAHYKNAAQIVLFGSHNHMIDFLEKGRNGMGSTLLVRMLVGERLIDAKGYSLLRQPREASSPLHLGSVVP